MRVYFDTEFLSEPPELHLISIGMVREDGKELYAVNRHAPWSRIYSHDWLNLNVVPHLPEDHDPAWKTPAEMRTEIAKFCGPAPEFWAYVAAYDWVLLTGLYGQFFNLPKGWPFWVHDLKHLMEQTKVKSLPPRFDGRLHDALADAWEVKNGYDWCMSYARSATEKGVKRTG